MPTQHACGAKAKKRRSAQSRHCADIGTRLANYTTSPSCGLPCGDGRSLDPAGGRIDFADNARAKGQWGGARNRADRVSHYLTRSQIEGLISAAQFSEAAGRGFNRHWTVHYERAGIAPEQGAGFVGRLLRLVGAYARRHGGKIAAIWVRENGEGKGAHVHILLHLPEGLTLRHRVRGWIKAAGGIYRRNVSKVRSIGGRLHFAKIDKSSEAVALYAANLAAVLGYVMKAAHPDVGEALALRRYGEGGRVVGKRCGRTQNQLPIKSSCKD